MTGESDWDRRFRESIDAENRLIAAGHLGSLSPSPPLVRFRALVALVGLLAALAVGAAAMIASESIAWIVAGWTLATGIVAAIASFGVAAVNNVRRRGRAASSTDLGRKTSQ